jgi:probable rRNA maturation factor
MKPQIEIAVESTLWASLDATDEIADLAIGETLRQFGDGLPDDPEVSLVFCDDDFIADLNERWRGQAKPTNVLSFPSHHPTMAVLGDIVVAYETAAREAADEGKTLRAHVTHLLVHGTLHLLGRDHIEESEAEDMENMERAVLAALGIADPYADTVVAGEVR